MPQHPKRETVDLSAYPDLVVIYLGMRVNAIMGFKTLLGFGPKISAAVEAKPDGLLLHKKVLFSLGLFGMRQYWCDFESLEAWSRSEPQRLWWQQFLRDTGDWLLARDVSPSRWHRGCVLGHAVPGRIGEVRAPPVRARRHALRPPEGRRGGRARKVWSRLGK